MKQKIYTFIFLTLLTFSCVPQQDREELSLEINLPTPYNSVNYADVFYVILSNNSKDTVNIYTHDGPSNGDKLVFEIQTPDSTFIVRKAEYFTWRDHQNSQRIAPNEQMIFAINFMRNELWKEEKTEEKYLPKLGPDGNYFEGYLNLPNYKDYQEINMRAIYRQDSLYHPLPHGTDYEHPENNKLEMYVGKIVSPWRKLWIR